MVNLIDSVFLALNKRNKIDEFLPFHFQELRVVPEHGHGILHGRVPRIRHQGKRHICCEEKILLIRSVSQVDQIIVKPKNYSYHQKI